jgi:hypothetical protein
MTTYAYIPKHVVTVVTILPDGTAEVSTSERTPENGRIMGYK